jgi:hypothetical protein
MPATQTTYSLGTLLLLSGVALPRPNHSPSQYSARVSGAVAATLGGSAEFGRPSNSAFRPRGGTLTITSSSWNRITGRFEMNAEGYLASAPEREDRTVTIRGSFNATASR